jgi:hypothetical protein
MMTMLKFISAIGLALTVVPAFFVFSGAITWNSHATMMVVGTVLWFTTAPFWMRPGPEGL